MRSSIGSWTFGNAPIEQVFARVSSHGYTGIDLTASAHLGRRAAPPGQRTQGDGGGARSLSLGIGATQGPWASWSIGWPKT
jgi:hypothetical protein